MARGGSVLVMMSLGGEAKSGTNINYLLEQCEICVTSDSVVRTVYHKYLHPQEVLVEDGVVNRGIGRAVWRLSGNKGVRENFDGKKKCVCLLLFSAPAPPRGPAPLRQPIALSSLVLPLALTNTLPQPVAATAAAATLSLQPDP